MTSVPATPLPGHSSSPAHPQAPGLAADGQQEYRQIPSRRSPEISGPTSFFPTASEGPAADPLDNLVRQKTAWEERSRILFENPATPLVIVDAGGSRVLEVNAAAIRLLGYSPEALAACDTVPFLEGGRIDHGLSRETRSTCHQHVFRSKCGELLDVEVTATLLAGSQDGRVLLSLRDLTREKCMHRHLEQVEKMVMMGRMASGIAHEIRNPLAAVMLNLQLLEHAPEHQPATRQSIHAALEGVNRIEQVVQNTLHLARSTPSRRERELLHGLIDRALWFLRVPLDHRGIRIQREYGSVDPAVMVDAKQVQQVLLNVLQNALEASPCGASIVIRTSSAVTGTGTELALVDVVDSGAGVAPEVLQHLFEPFRTTKPGGTGLGMTISRQIMEQHSGAITIPATGPGGTTVRLEFPLLHSPSGATHV